mmetsp:Transcript_20819/g.66516  ORF Transcript_20819/g.66516 Transcript_20819/m.66516 type:complete len:226 (+) Transcript_20819:657-1334(+)
MIWARTLCEPAKPAKNVSARSEPKVGCAAVAFTSPLIKGIGMCPTPPEEATSRLGQRSAAKSPGRLRSYERPMPSSFWLTVMYRTSLRSRVSSVLRSCRYMNFDWCMRSVHWINNGTNRPKRLARCAESQQKRRIHKFSSQGPLKPLYRWVDMFSRYLLVAASVSAKCLLSSRPDSVAARSWLAGRQASKPCSCSRCAHDSKSSEDVACNPTSSPSVRSAAPFAE